MHKLCSQYELSTLIRSRSTSSTANRRAGLKCNINLTHQFYWSSINVVLFYASNSLKTVSQLRHISFVGFKWPFEFDLKNPFTSQNLFVNFTSFLFLHYMQQDRDRRTDEKNRQSGYSARIIQGCKCKTMFCIEIHSYVWTVYLPLEKKMQVTKLQQKPKTKTKEKCYKLRDTEITKKWLIRSISCMSSSAGVHSHLVLSDDQKLVSSRCRRFIDAASAETQWQALYADPLNADASAVYTSCLNSQTRTSAVAGRPHNASCH